MICQKPFWPNRAESFQIGRKASNSGPTVFKALKSGRIGPIGSALRASGGGGQAGCDVSTDGRPGGSNGAMGRSVSAHGYAKTAFDAPRPATRCLSAARSYAAPARLVRREVRHMRRSDAGCAIRRGARRAWAGWRVASPKVTNPALATPPHRTHNSR